MTHPTHRSQPPRLTLQTNFTNKGTLNKGAARDGDGLASQTPRPLYSIVRREAEQPPREIETTVGENARPHGTFGSPVPKDDKPGTVSLEQETARPDDLQRREPGSPDIASGTAVRGIERTASETGNLAPTSDMVAVSKGSSCRTCSDERTRCPGGHSRCRHCVERNLVCLYEEPTRLGD